MIQETSREAYNTIKANGLLSKRRFEVYEFIAQTGPCSINRLLSEKAWAGKNTGSLTGRISELRDMGVIAPWGEEVAPTGHRVILWTITKNLPVRRPKSETKTRIIERLTKENEDFKALLAKQDKQLSELRLVRPTVQNEKIGSAHSGGY